MNLKNKMTLAEIKTWLQEQGASCHMDGPTKVVGVVRVDHIRPGELAAFFVREKSDGIYVYELPQYFTSGMDAWDELVSMRPKTQRPLLFSEWVREQYILDRNAKVERLEI